MVPMEAARAIDGDDKSAKDMEALPLQAWPAEKGPAASNSTALEGTTPAASSEATSTMRSLATDSGIGTDGVTWQWLHKTGFRDYKASDTRRIEYAYQSGACFVRLKTGKKGSTPMELFFNDRPSIQYDPTTGNSREIRRLGVDPFRSKAKRRMKEIVTGIEKTGRPRPMRSSDRYGKTIADLAKGATELLNAGPGEMKKGSCCTKVVRSSLFSFLSALGVLLNTLWIWVDADYNTAPTLLQADTIFVVVENVFCILFTVELSFRFGAFRKKWASLGDTWFLFDASLVSLMWFETWLMPFILYISGQDKGGEGLKQMSILRMARMLRLTRLARITRLLRAVPEVMTLLKGIIAAMRSVFFTIVLLGCFLYLFAVIFRVQGSQYKSDPKFAALFDTVPMCMWTLLIKGCFLDDPSSPLEVLRNKSKVLTFLFVCFIFISSFTILNMLIGILCDVVHKVSEAEKDRAAALYLQNTLLEILECYDKDEDKSLGKEEFAWLMQNPEIHVILSNFGVDAADLLKMKDVLFEEKFSMQHTNDVEGGDEAVSHVRKLTFDEMLEKIMRLRGGNASSVHDVVELREYIGLRMEYIELKCVAPITPAVELGLAPPVPELKCLAPPEPSPTMTALPGDAATATQVPMSAFEQAVLARLDQLGLDQQALASKVTAWQEELSKKQDAIVAEVAAVREKVDKLEAAV